MDAVPDVHTDARGRRLVLVAVAAGALLSVLLGVYGKVHTPTGGTIVLFGFGGMIQMKVWLALVTGVLVLAQLVTALWMYGRLALGTWQSICLVDLNVDNPDREVRLSFLPG